MCSEIATLLRHHAPLVRVLEFIGQSSVKSKGIPQKEQARIVKEFREGRCNTLVATCIGEEGLDIGS